MDGPLRVLHAVVNMNRGGAETFIMNLYRNVDRSKIQFDFLTCYEGVFDEEIRSMGGIVYRIPYVTQSGHFAYVKKLNHFFHHHRHYKIVHSHMDKMSGLVLKAAAEAGIPARIAHSHNTSSEGNSLIRMYKWLAGRNIPKYATDFYACSSKAAAWLFPHHSKTYSIIKNGIESERFEFSLENRKEVRKSLQLREESFLVGHIGRFNKQKNHLFLLDVFHETLKNHPDAHLLLVGTGTLQSKIEQKIKLLGIEDRVHLLGVRNDIPQLLQAIDVFAFPSLHEGLPVTLIEAQCSGVPCVISNNITQEVDLGCGLIRRHPIEDPKVWAAALLSTSQSKQIRKSQAKLISMHGYNIQNTASITENSYLKLGGMSG
ncbi:glycosyltransferase family 1 protein [Jeotgalibacillus sp. ET6]|uniref:glycosyltransferase family 1 protein n=1 Tax=Jeotgalibacillus sp. ET6 TaxID=3037260 RepID=UPI0024183573|nr:glycosyltransferase family 1 protein [Jeotgalibacillus sp. ET6]MDG5472604.1 glycosyltransferase family 1 protein [Jeotgalibacillus sp. ET6]